MLSSLDETLGMKGLNTDENPMKEEDPTHENDII